MTKKRGWMKICPALCVFWCGHIILTSDMAPGLEKSICCRAEV